MQDPQSETHRPSSAHPQLGTLLTTEIHSEHDVALARQRARQVAGVLGFSVEDQTRIATAASEIARNAFSYAGGGKVEFVVAGMAAPQMLQIRVRDEGPGIQNLDDLLAGKYASPTGMGLGIAGARRLMDEFHIASGPGKGTTVLMGKRFPSRVGEIAKRDLPEIADKLSALAQQTPLEELRHQDHELLRTLEELTRANRELEETNRGVVALYAELEDKAVALRRGSEIKSRFLSHVSHELRTPLKAILALSHLLLDRADGDLTEGQEKQVGYIRDSGAGLYELIDDLLDIARVEAGKVELRPVEFEVADVFGALRGMMKAIDVKPAVSLVIEEPCGIPPLLADENKVTQILRNLVSNALKFTERGQVRVSAQMDPGGAAVVFSVSDTGIGIAPEDQERVFEEFVQLDSPVQRSVKGTGLGLPLSRSLAEVLGGSLSVESQPGVGSTFTAVIPVVCSTVDAAATGVTASVQELDENRSPVLIVEDDLETVQLYENYLKGSGFQIIRAATAAEARKMLAECKPMAIVLDILLPGEDGWVLLSDLNGDATTRDIPVLVVTIVKDEQKAMALGAHDYCLKPVGQRWLLGKLEALSPVEKVLIIDDEEVSRYLFKGLLADTKYTLLEAASGAEGLRRAREEQPQAIFLDLIMPEMDGFEVLKQLRSDPDTRNIPVVVYTSRKLDHGERQWLSQRAVAIVQKDGQPREAAIAQLKDALVKARQSSREPAGESPDE